MRLLITCVLAFVLGFLLMFAVSPAFAQGQIAYRAIDGDTLKNANESIRIVGFDAPETFFAQCKAEKMLGDKATQRLQALVGLAWGDGALEVNRTCLKDRYKRTLAYIRVQGVDVGEILISEGLAVPYACPKNRCPKRIDWCAKQ